MMEVKKTEPAAYSTPGLAAAALRFLGELTNRFPAAWITRSTQLALDGAVCMVALFAAYQLRFDANVPAPHRLVMWSLMLLLPVFRPLLMWALGAYDAIWRYFNLRDAAVLALSAAPASLVLLAMRYLVAPRFWGTVVPTSVIIIEFGAYLILAIALRGFRRVTYEITRPAQLRPCRALLVGTEATLPQAQRHLHGAGEIEIVGLLAPEPHLLGMRIGGSMVLEKPAALARLLVTRRIDLVLIADSRPDSIAETVATATEFGADVRLLPSAANVVRGDVQIFAKAAPESAINRSLEADAQAGYAEPHTQVLESFRDRVVLITGAGGSIGSELARQVVALPVSSLLLLDRDENSIFELSHALAAMAVEGNLRARLVPIVGDVRDAEYLRVIFQDYRPHVVLHAAAYKHVPIMESNVCEAVLNNVVGTRLLAQTAVNFGAERFVMISTDKAVHPSSVMGATKRIAEMVVTDSARSLLRPATPAATTRMACVRFGNVVGSRGSVVPIFLRQINAGGPITITDEHMTRYFMTIPEASQLVLQAASLASEGSIYMLDMGDPIKITALARKLIELSGLRPGKDIEIRFIGTRPGEKIAEQLWVPGTEVAATDFPRVLEVRTEEAPADFQNTLAYLEQAALSRNESAVLEKLRHMPIGFAQAAATVTPFGKTKNRSAFLN
jgi:UDP-N-acetylglucosamine 4,6-dehydratase